MKTWLPWRDHHEDLSVSRLIDVGNVLRTIWRRVSELHEPGEGDGFWSLSCRAFQRCGYQLTRRQEDWSWLSISQEKSMQWLLCFGVIPVRFYHGDSEEVPARYAEPLDTEKALRQAILNLDDRIKEGELLRIVTETDLSGVPQAIKLLKCEESSGEVISSFIIPEALEASGTVERFPMVALKPGVIQPKPVARPLFGRAKGQSRDDSGEKK
jgi:hypothetical protein